LPKPVRSRRKSLQAERLPVLASTRFRSIHEKLTGLPMPDRLTPSQRSYCMSRIRSKNTRPEVAVRSIIHCMGFRFRLHQPDLPGRPDIVLPRHRKIVLVHGCFWHVHTCRAGRVRPSVNVGYWQGKRRRNVARDRRTMAALNALGWKVLVIWECELAEPAAVRTALTGFLSPNRARGTQDRQSRNPKKSSVSKRDR
jgi:DNA mismatch endonuclease (patch repair protein)